MNQEQIVIKNFELFKAQTAKLGSKAGNLIQFLDENAERVMLAPASTRKEFTCCYPGGLVEHSLRVLQNAAKLRQVYGQVESIETNSLILTSLYHDIGKVGTDNKEYYVDNNSDWHRDKLGILYNVADRFQHISVSQLSLLRLTQNKVDIDIDEWYSISVIGNKNIKDDVPNTAGEPWLSVILSQSVKAACIQGGGRVKVSPIQ